jgi:hypothetical protein
VAGFDPAERRSASRSVELAELHALDEGAPLGGREPQGGSAPLLLAVADRPPAVLCGRLIDPAPLVTPIGSPCGDCAAALRGIPAGGASAAPSHHRLPPTTGSWWSSWKRSARGRPS